MTAVKAPAMNIIYILRRCNKMWEKIKLYFKEQSTAEKKKLKDMTLKEKIEYIWEYYKLHITAAVIVVFIAASVINNVMNPPVPSYAGITFYEVYISDEDNDAIKQVLTEALIENRDEYEIYMHHMVSGGDPQAEMAIVQKLMAMIMVNEIDIIIAERDVFASFAYEEFLADLNRFGVVFPKELVMESQTAENPELMPYGVSLSGSPLFNALGITQWMDLYVGVAGNVDKPDHAVNILKFFFGL